MEKEKFIKQVKKEISSIPKYANSPSQVDAIVEEMWNESQAIEKTKELAKEQLEKIEPKPKSKKKRKK